MNTVTIYKREITKAFMMGEQGTNYSLQPWGANTVYYEGSDDGGKEYVLPEGYKVAEDTFGSPHIYDSNDTYCELFTAGRRELYPAIVDDYGRTIRLKLASDVR